MPPSSPAASLWPVHLRLLLMAAVWGASWPWGRMVAQSMPPLTASALRCAIAGVALLWVLRRAARLDSLLALRPRQWLGLAAAAATGILAYSCFFMLALQHVPAGRASVVITLNPVVTLVLAAWLFKERLNAWILLGMALAVSGALIALTHGQPQQLLTGGLGRGEWLLLGCVLSWVAYTLAGRVMLAGVDALTACTASVLLGGLMLGVAGGVSEGAGAWQLLAQAPAASWGALLALGLLATAVAYVWFFAGIKALGAGNASAYITLVPVFGLGFATLWLGEPMRASLAVGAAVAVTGVVVMHLGRTRWG